MNLSAAYPLLLLIISNIFMTYAWYGHLKTMKDSPIWIVILASWGIAFFEYMFQVPANRLGFEHYSLPQLKIIQEVVTILVFIVFSTFYMNQAFKWDYLWAGLCMVGAVYFVFK